MLGYFSSIVFLFLCLVASYWLLSLYVKNKTSIYSRTSVARTLMARLLRLFRTRWWVPKKNCLSCSFRVIFLFCIGTVYCVYLLKSPQWVHTTYLHVKENQSDIPIMPPDLAPLSTLIGLNYPCLKLIFMVPMVLEPLKFYCIYMAIFW